MTGIFEVVAHTMDADAERVGGSRVRVAVAESAKASYEGYLASSETEAEFEARLSYITPDLRMVVMAACAEHDYDNPAEILEEVTATLREKSAWNFDKKKDDDEDDKDDGDDNSDDEDEGKGKDAHEASVHVADDARSTHGDTYQSERIDVSTGPDASPSIDKNKVPADGLDSIDVGSTDHPRESQSVTDKPDYGDGTGAADQTKHPHKTVDADTPMQGETTRGDGGTFTDGPASAVTSAVEGKWSILD